MVIKNLTSKQQKVDVKELLGAGRVYPIYIEPKGITELELVQILELEKYAGILEIVGCKCEAHVPVEVQTPKEVETPIETSEPTEEVEVSEESSGEVTEDETTEEVETQVAADSFVCELCGAEFASARGLNTHKNKAHAE